MARVLRLLPTRLGAAMALLLAPLCAAAGPALDINDLRARLHAAESSAADVAGTPVDVEALRATLGLAQFRPAVAVANTSDGAKPAAPTEIQVAEETPAKPEPKPALAPMEIAPVAVPAPAAAGGLFALQTAQPGDVAPATGTASLGAGGLFAVQNAQPQTVIAPQDVIGTEPLFAPKTTAAAAIAPQPRVAVEPDGGLFAAQTAQAIPTATAVLPTGGAAGLVPLDATVSNFRLMLATLAQTYSGVNNLSVLTAQGPRGAIALSVKAGTVTLDDLKSLSAAHGHAPRDDGSMTIPIVIWPEATLRLSPGDRLGLARDAGAFVLSMGHLEVTGATIETTGPENPHEKIFTPFMTITSGGSLLMEGATLRGLGFGRTLKFAGLTVAGNPLMPTKQDVTIRNTLFEQMRTVSVAGAPGALIEGNTFQDARGNAFNLVGSPHAQLRGNLFRGASPTNAVRIGVGSDHAVIADNVVLRGERVAILIEGGSNNVEVRDNVVWKRDGGGIKFFRSQCGLAQGNILIDNGQKGIEVRKSDGTALHANVLAGGRSAGVWVSAQAMGARTTVQGNHFVRNASGLSAATGADIWLQGNDFSKQFPKLLDGDISALTPVVSRDLSGALVHELSKGQSQVHDHLASFCGGDT